MTMIREKTNKVIKETREFMKSFLRENVDTIVKMEPSEYSMVTSMIKFVDDSLDLAEEQARVIEEVDRKLDELNSKMDILLKQKG